MIIDETIAAWLFTIATIAVLGFVLGAAFRLAQHLLPC